MAQCAMVCFQQRYISGQCKGFFLACNLSCCGDTLIQVLSAARKTRGSRYNKRFLDSCLFALAWEHVSLAFESVNGGWSRLSLAGWDDIPADTLSDLPISIHPPLAGWDEEAQFRQGAPFISIHPPLAGWDSGCKAFRRSRNISIHPPLAGWDLADAPPDMLLVIISIHPPLAGWDGYLWLYDKPSEISIHPPLAGWDDIRACHFSRRFYFNPPTPRGVGPRSLTYARSTFQSTHPSRGGTQRY